MMLSGFFSLLFLAAAYGASIEKACSYQDVLNYLKLTKNNELFSMTRPVKDYKQPTRVYLEVLLYAILDVKEIDQTFVPYVRTVMSWQNQHIQWNPDDFCGIKVVSLPTNMLWKPDLTIEEMTETNKAPPSPYLSISSDGLVSFQNNHMLISTCRMHVYKFPFDTQSCNLSFKSILHPSTEIQLASSLNSLEITDMMMRTQYEWQFISMKVTNKTVSMIHLKQDLMIYTITMKRRSLLYVVNFLLPVLFLLCLDLASFLISEREGEKLSFKVTVLLAVTVMQLILVEILPSSSDRIPLIVAYCFGIFGLMMLSLLETILVMHLMEKDEEGKDQSLREDCNQQDKSRGDVKKWTACVCDVSADETAPQLLKDSSNHVVEESYDTKKVSDELTALTVLLSSTKGEEKPRYWTRKTKTIRRVFFILYFITIVVFLGSIFFSWNAQD